MILDANVLVRLVLPGDYRQQNLALWSDLLATGAECVVPTFCPVEVISSLRQMARDGLITPEREEQAFEEYLTDIHPVLVTVDSPVLLRTAWQLARDLDQRHTYDSVYLAIAQSYTMEFWTADQQLLRRLAGRFPEARFLGDYPLTPPAP